MHKSIFVRDDLIAKAGISESVLKEWEEQKLVKPDGLMNDEVPYYIQNTVDKILYIKQFVDLGYKLEDIQKIIKRVGLPKRTHEDKKAKKLHEYLTIGDLAGRVGVSPRAIKHWEDKKIIEADMRSEGGFRLYSESYVLICQLIKDLQLFGYSLEEIKVIADQFRDFLAIKSDIKTYPVKLTQSKLSEMQENIQVFFTKMELYKKGIERWEDLLKKRKKEITNLIAQNEKRKKGKSDNE